MRQIWLLRRWYLSVILLLLFPIFFVWRTLPAYLDQHQQATQNVFSPTIHASGLLQSPVYNLYFQNNSATTVLSEIDVHQGDFVHKGQVLARLNTKTLRTTLAGEHLAVAAGRNYVQSALNLLKRALQEHTAFVAAGQNALRAAQINLNATYQQDQANITVTQVTLADDEQVLIDTRIQAAAQIQAAQVQLIQNKAACQTAFNTDSSSQRQSSSAPTAADLLKVCLQAAQTQLQQSVANAQSPVVSALATVVNDRVLLAQAIASARADVVGAQGAVVVARDQVPIAIYETGPFEAERDVTDAQHALALDLGAFWNAQVALTNSLLLAPHDGVVTAINGTIGSSPGTTVDIASFAPGSGPSGTFIQLIDLSRVDQMLLKVSETDIVNVKAGQHVQFTITAYSTRQFSGTVSAVSPNGVSTNGKMGFPVIVSIDTGSTQGLTLYPNMTTSATISS